MILNIYTVAFFGHRYIDNTLQIEEQLEKYIYKLIEGNEYVDFVVGRNGDFDRLVSSTVTRIRKNYRSGEHRVRLFYVTLHLKEISIFEKMTNPI